LLRYLLTNSSSRMRCGVLACLVCLAFCSVEALHARESPDGSRFAALAAESRRQGGTSLVISKNGRVVFAEFTPAVGFDTRIPTLSITKTLLAIAGWQAQGRGWWSLQDPVGKFIPAWENHPARILDLLNFSGGLDGGRAIFYCKHLKGKRVTAAKQKPRGLPRQEFVYGPASYEVLGEAFTRLLESQSAQLERKSPLAFFHKNLMQPIGASVASWRSDTDGTPFFSTGAWMSPRQLLALGELIRNDGRIGWRRVFQKGFLSALQNGAPDFPVYYLGIWRNLAARNPDSTEVHIEASIGQFSEREWWAHRCISKAAPPDLLVLAGSGGQRVYIMPRAKMVIVRTGPHGGKTFDDARFLAGVQASMLR